MTHDEKKKWCRDRLIGDRSNCEGIEKATGIPAGALRQFRANNHLGYERVEKLYAYLKRNTEPAQEQPDMRDSVLKLYETVNTLRNTVEALGARIEALEKQVADRPHARPVQHRTVE